MFKATFFLVTLSLVLVAISSAEVPQEDTVALGNTVRDYSKCPCKCLIGRRKRKAASVCRRNKFRFQCKVSECVPTYSRFNPHGSKGLMCCEKDTPPKPTTTASATPSVTPTPTMSTTATTTATPTPTVSTTATASATPTPSTSPKKICPCLCTKKFFAIRGCQYKPHCQVIKCSDQHHAPGYHQPERFQCCDPPHVAPVH